MKKLFLIATFLLASTICSAQEFNVNEARPAIAKYKITTVEFNFVEKVAVANIVMLDGDGNIVGQTAIGINGPQFDTLLNNINIDKQALTAAIKNKMGK